MFTENPNPDYLGQIRMNEKHQVNKNNWENRNNKHIHGHITCMLCHHLVLFMGESFEWENKQSVFCSFMNHVLSTTFINGRKIQPERNSFDFVENYIRLKTGLQCWKKKIQNCMAAEKEIIQFSNHEQHIKIKPLHVKFRHLHMFFFFNEAQTFKKYT